MSDPLTEELQSKTDEELLELKQRTLAFTKVAMEGTDDRPAASEEDINFFYAFYQRVVAEIERREG